MLSRECTRCVCMYRAYMFVSMYQIGIINVVYIVSNWSYLLLILISRGENNIFMTHCFASLYLVLNVHISFV